MAHTNVWGKDGLPTSIRKVVHSSDQDSLAVYARSVHARSLVSQPRSGARNFGPGDFQPAILDHTLDNEPRFSRRLEFTGTTRSAQCFDIGTRAVADDPSMQLSHVEALKVELWTKFPQIYRETIFQKSDIFN